MAFFATFWTWGFPPAKVRGARGEARKSKKFDLPPFYNGKMTVWETESVGDFQRICVNGGGISGGFMRSLSYRALPLEHFL